MALQANVLIDDWGHPRVCDFGLSRFIHSQESSGLTTTTAYTGTARYLAHELVESEESTLPTKESDVHALSCIGYEVRTSTQFLLNAGYAHPNTLSSFYRCDGSNLIVRSSSSINEYHMPIVTKLARYYETSSNAMHQRLDHNYQGTRRM